MDDKRSSELSKLVALHYQTSVVVAPFCDVCREIRVQRHLDTILPDIEPAIAFLFLSRLIALSSGIEVEEVKW